MAAGSIEKCRWCLANGLAGAEPAASNQTQYLMLKLTLPNPSAMVIPFRHVETPFEFSSVEWSDLGKMLEEAKRRLDQFQPEGFTIGWNVGASGGQHILHAHMHVVCRYEKDPKAGQGIRDLLR
ncbi:HIT domain-containing protein [Agrobacterium rhizogenes]|nr:HIT domain-containing protein [Rhizobium rhizogenes]NTG23239.1 HIT domain-containing protein [Rhizobium rhizogenes]NTG29985.1 HIT domain-containing protein [Rhizobium rhizogenes]NTH40682.1 HIT domain-containing protein [Rhizobium rhizogenes]NTH66620.1 HIT domain-containing protein [Rhizobium rhizogenes]